MSIVMLYLSAMTVFMSVLVWDTERVANKKGECCGACCCKEDTVICCGGTFLSQKQREYGGLTYTEKQLATMKAEEEAANPALKTALKAGIPERFLAKYFAPFFLSKIGRIATLIVYLILIIVAIYGST